ncbi:MAG TPA: efflux RND transporter periplasmic adaptor subunit [Burkholderiales bacterium]|nr:efflux RND transporter periplasmic adaptor subunit [Burkholderiales bacterium]
MNRTVRTCVSLLSGIILAGSLASWTARAANELKVSAEQMRALGVETVKIQSAEAGELHGLAAQVMVPPGQMQIVAAPVPGLVESMRVAAHDAVSKGQVVARLQSPALLEAQRSYLQAATQAQLAEQNLRRDEALVQEGIIPESRHEATRSVHDEAQALLAERRHALQLMGMSETAIRKLRSTRRYVAQVELVAPATGVVIEQTATAGQRVDAAAPLYKIADLSRLWLEVQVPVQRANALTPGAPVSVPSCGAKAKVLAVGKSVDPANQTVSVRAEIITCPGTLWPGQYVEAVIATRDATPDKQWKLPTSALVHQSGKIYVFVQIKDGFRAQAVTVVSQSAQESTVSAPFTGQEHVASRGTAGLKAAWQG